MEDGITLSEIINSEEYSRYEKAQIVEVVSGTDDLRRKKVLLQ